MIDERTLAYINLFAVLGAIPSLCELDSEAKELIKNDNISIGFAVRGGPAGTLIFEGGKCRMAEGASKCQVKLPFSSPKKFNGMINGTVTPIPSHGFLKIGFLLKKFMPLTDILEKYLRPSAEALSERDFFIRSTKLLFGVITRAIVEIGNNDKVGMFSASNIPDGIAKLEIKGEAVAAISITDHRLSLCSNTDAYTSYMSFESIDIARDLFDGKINAVAAVGLGQVRVGGMISAVDNINRILDRVSMYLA